MLRPRHSRYQAPKRWPPGSGVLLALLLGMVAWLLLLRAAGVL